MHTIKLIIYYYAKNTMFLFNISAIFILYIIRSLINKSFISTFIICHIKKQDETTDYYCYK